MVAEFDLKAEDVRAFNHFHHRHSPVLRRQYRRQAFIFPMLWLGVCTLIWYGADRQRGTPLRTFLDLWPLFGLVPFWMIYFPLAHRWRMRRLVAAMVKEGENRSLFTRHRVSISPDGVRDSTDLTQNSIKWSGVERMANNDDYLFIYTSALAAIIVPRRAFATPTEFQQFIDVARGYVK